MKLTEEEENDVLNLTVSLRDMANMAIFDASKSSNEDAKSIYLNAADNYVANSNLIIRMAEHLGVRGLGPLWVREGLKLVHIHDAPQK